MLFTVLHAVAKQPIKIAKKATKCAHYVVTMVTSNGFLMLFLMLLKDITHLYTCILAIKKSFASLSFIVRQCKMQKCK